MASLNPVGRGRVWYMFCRGDELHVKYGIALVFMYNV